MKKISIALVACLAISAGCTNRQVQAEVSAQGFLDAFLANDYDKALQMCSEDFKGHFSKAVSGFRDLDSDIQKLLFEQCALYKAQVVASERINGSDTFKVNYKIVKAAADSAIFETGVINSSLLVVDDKVCSLD